MAVKDKLKTHLFPTIWCPGCGIGLIMQQLASVMDELGLDKSNTVLVTGIGCTGRMGAYMNFESVYTLHGRTLPVAEAIKCLVARIVEMEQELDEIHPERKGKRQKAVRQTQEMLAEFLAFDEGAGI